MIDRKSLLDHLKNTGIVLGEFAPGYLFNVLVDMREGVLQGGYLEYIAEEIWKNCKKYDFSVLVGTGYGALPLIIAVQLVAYRDGVYLKSLIARDERKERNRRRLVEGPRPKQNERALFVDDVMNHGSTLEKTKTSLLTEGINVEIVAAAVLYDFWTFTGSRGLEATGLPVFRMFTRHDFGFTREDSEIDSPFTELIWRSLKNNQWKRWYKTKPLIDGELVYYGTDRHEVFCHSIYDGNLLWSYDGLTSNRQKGLGCKFAIDHEYLYVTSYSGTVTKLNKKTGDLVWRVRLDRYIHSAPVLANTEILVVGTEGGIGISGAVKAISISSGKELWSVEQSEATPCTPYVLDDLVVCGSNDKNLYGIDLQSGGIRWVVQNIGEVKGQATSIGDVIVVMNEKGYLTAISKEGNTLWNRTAGLNSVHQHLQTNGKYVFSCNRSSVVAHDIDGNQIWFRQLRANPFWNLSYKDGELLVVTTNGHLRFLDVESGEILSGINMGSAVNCPADFTKEHVAVGTLSKGLYVYKRK